MSAVEVFQFPVTGARVRTTVIDGEPWFVAADVCAVLGYGDGGARSVVGRLPERMRGVTEFNTPGGTQRLTIINEAGVYRLVMRSTLPGAEEFQDWLAEEVVPSIRRTGQYGSAVALPVSYADALRELAATVERAEVAQLALQAAAPKAEAWDVLASATGDYSVREAAYILNRDPAVSTGQQRLFQLLRDWALIDRKDIPYADHARHVRLRARSYTSPRSGEDRTSEQVRITADGLRYLHKRMGGTKPLAVDQPAA